jgi:hypothetical protein
VEFDVDLNLQKTFGSVPPAKYFAEVVIDRIDE